LQFPQIFGAISGTASIRLSIGFARSAKWDDAPAFEPTFEFRYPNLILSFDTQAASTDAVPSIAFDASDLVASSEIRASSAIHVTFHFDGPAALKPSLSLAISHPLEQSN
jgi:hypothetical protein